MPIQRRTALLFILTVLAAGLITILPELVPALTPRPGLAWTPFHSANYRFGDLAYYAPWVREILDGHVPPQSPVATLPPGVFTHEAVRLVPLLMAALPGLIIDDMRWVLIAGLGLWAAAWAGAAFVIAYFFLRNPSRAMFAAFLVLFGLRFWHLIPIAPTVFASASLAVYVHLLEPLKTASMQVWNAPDYELISDAFRFVQMSTAGPLLAIWALSLLAVVFRPVTVATAAAASVMFACIFFTYPTHTVISGLLVAVAVVYLLARRDYRRALLIGGGATIIGVALLAAGYLRFAYDAYSFSPIISEIYSARLAWMDRPLWTVPFVVFLNKYGLITMLVMTVSRPGSPLRLATIGLYIVTVLLTPILLVDLPDLWGRFFHRGVDLLWWPLAAIVVTEISFRLLPKPWLRAAVVCAAVALPAAGFARAGMRNAVGESRWMPADSMDAYAWLRRSVPADTVVLAGDWDDVGLLPFFTSVNLTYSNVELSARRPDDELRRYACSWKVLGRSRERLQEQAQRAVAMEHKRVADGFADMMTPRFGTHPFLEAEDYAVSRIVTGLLYYPYNKVVAGLPIRIGPSTTNPQVIDLLLQAYDSCQPAQFVRDSGTRFVLLRQGRDVLDPHLPRKTVYENPLYRIEELEPFPL